MVVASAMRDGWPFKRVTFKKVLELCVAGFVSLLSGFIILMWIRPNPAVHVLMLRSNLFDSIYTQQPQFFTHK